MTVTLYTVGGDLVAPYTVGAAATAATVTVTMPPASVESSEETMRDMGRLGAHIVGHYWTLGSSWYVCYTQGGVVFDPGDHDAALAGRTGIMVALAGSSQTAAQVATATAAAINTVVGLSAVAVGANVEIEGAGSAAAGSRSWDDAVFGVAGMPTANLAGLNSFPNGATSASLLDPASLPAEPVLVTGFRVSCSNVHTAQLTVAVYQGGAADNDFSGAALVGVVGVTTGSGTNQNLYAAATTPFVLDPSAGRIWIAWSHDAGDFEAAYPFDTGNPTQNAAITSSDWVMTGGAGIFECNTVPLSSDPGDWPATLGAVTNTTIAVPTIALSYVTVADFQCDMLVVGRFGTRADAGDYTGTSDNTLLVGNSHTSPATLGMVVLDAAVAYAVHESGSDYRLSLAVGGAADNNFSGATFYDIGRAGGTATGWVTVTPPGSIAIPASSRIWIAIHHTEGVAPVSSLAFDPGASPDVHDPVTDPAAYYNGNTTESEADDGSLGGTPSTNVTFDEAVAQSGVVSPNGTNYNNNNNVGVRMRYAVPGFAVAA